MKLPTVEINNTFYRMPKPEVVDSWAGQVGPEFRFAVKAPRRITHIKRLRDVADETSYLLEVLAEVPRFIRGFSRFRGLCARSAAERFG